MFVFISDYGTGTDEARGANRSAHLSYWTEANGTKLFSGGPLLDGDGKPVGSLLIIDAATEGEARSLYDNDPYVTAGVARLKTVMRYRNAISQGRVA